MLGHRTGAGQAEVAPAAVEAGSPEPSDSGRTTPPIREQPGLGFGNNPAQNTPTVSANAFDPLTETKPMAGSNSTCST